jgi:hypothetical protein
MADLIAMYERLKRLEFYLCEMAYSNEERGPG